MPILSPVLSPKKTHILNPCCIPSLPPRITGEKRGIFRGVSTQNGGKIGQHQKKMKLFLTNFGLIWAKNEHLIGWFENSRDLSCWTVGIHACSSKSTCGTLRVFSENPKRWFRMLMPEQNQIARPSKGCSHRGLKNKRKDSTNVRHTAIAKVAKDPSALARKKWSVDQKTAHAQSVTTINSSWRDRAVSRARCHSDEAA